MWAIFMEQYLQWKQSHVQQRTLSHYRRWIIKFEKFLKYSGKDIKQVDIVDVSMFKEYLEDQEYAPKNIEFGLHIIRGYLSYLNTMKVIDIPVSLIKIKLQRSKSHYAITRKDFATIMLELKDDEPLTLQRKLMLMMLWDTGMRVGELLSIKITDLEKRHTIIHNEKNTRKRLVSWSEDTEKLLQKYLPLRKELPSSCDALFVSFQYRPCRALTTRTVERIVKDLREKAKLKNEVRPHSFRHGFVHRQLEKRTPITTIAQMLGHSSTSNVLNYSQLADYEIHGAWGLTI